MGKQILIQCYAFPEQMPLCLLLLYLSFHHSSSSPSFFLISGFLFPQLFNLFHCYLTDRTLVSQWLMHLLCALNETFIFPLEIQPFVNMDSNMKRRLALNQCYGALVVEALLLVQDIVISPPCC